jgi:AcrR family transcriptional regulator
MLDLIDLTVQERKEFPALAQRRIATHEAPEQRHPRGRPRDSAADVLILDATERALAARGYEAMTMDRVAVAAGVSKPTIYLRFGSKAALVAAMIDRLEPPVPRPRGRSARADLVTLIQVEEQWVGRHGRRLVAAVLLEEADHPELLDQFRQRVVEPVRAAFHATLKAGIARGELRQGANRAEVIDALTGAYWARFWATGAPRRGWAPRLVDAVLQGLVLPERRPDTGDVHNAERP